MMREQTFMKLMRLLPKSALSHAVGWATRLKAPAPLHRMAMRGFARSYSVDMSEAAQGFEGYATFAEFFTRALKPGARTFEAGERVLASPVDGAVSQVGYAHEGQCVQAKGVSYPLERLLGSTEAAAPFI